MLVVALVALVLAVVLVVVLPAGCQLVVMEVQGACKVLVVRV